MTINPKRALALPDFEPLPDVIADKLDVPGNSAIPLMMHLQQLTLPMFVSKKEDLIIKSKNIPRHYLWTLNQLEMIQENSDQIEI